MGVWWCALAPRVRVVCEEVAADVTGGSLLIAGWDYVWITNLRHHPIYAAMLNILQPLVNMTREEFAAQLPHFPQIPYSTAFAIPGSPVGMELLRHAIQPPLVIFSDKTWAPWETFALGDFVKAAAAPIAKASLELWEAQKKLDRSRALEGLRQASPEPARSA
jgi:hypothetical protein